MIYKIKHYEESVGYFEVEADDEDGALNKYYQMLNDGKIDFSGMEMINSSDTLVRPEFEVGQECYFSGFQNDPSGYFVITTIYIFAGERYFDAIYLDGRTMTRIALRPERIWRTGKIYPFFIVFQGGQYGKRENQPESH